MHRRALLTGMAGAGLAAAACRQAFAAEARRYRLVAELDITGHPGEAQLWVPLAQSAGTYQKASAPCFQASGHAKVVRDERYGAAMLRVSWADGAGPRTVRIEQLIETSDRSLEPQRLTAAQRRLWTSPTASMPIDGIVLETAQRVAGGHAAPRAKARAIYDWVVDNTFRDAAVKGCGIGGVESMLKSGYLGGKCADINSLMTALCRASGLPARDVYGVRLGPSQIQPVLGARTSDVTKAQHCRVEVHLDGEGWLPVDPADVRKVVLEANLPVESPQVKAERERLFGSWEMNWAGYNSATDIALPGATRPPEEHFLMYPLAMTPAGELDQLDAASFKYKLTSTAA